MMERHHSSHPRQSGFTLIELLIALALTLVIVVAVQRYVAGVTSDQEHLTQQQDQTSQTFIVMGNIQRDVARAGFTPVAAHPSAALAKPVTVQKCTINECKGDELIIQYWQYASGAIYDCVGHEVKKTNNWGLVENIYRVKDSGELACSGNGGTSARTESLLNDVVSFSWQLSAKDTNTGAQILSLCFTTQLDATQSVVKTGEAKNCVTGKTWTPPAGSTDFYQTTRMDLWVRPQTIPLAAVPQESAK